MTTRVVAVCVFLLWAAPAGAVDTVMPGAGRSSPVVPIAPAFVNGLQLQPGLSNPGLNTGVGEPRGVPALNQPAPQLQGLEVPAFGFQKRAQTIPALPQSAVLTGQAAAPVAVAPLSVLQTQENAAALLPDVSRRHQEAEQSLVPAMQRVAREVSQKSEALEAPLEAVTRRGANAPSSEAFKRSGAEVFDILAAASGNGRDLSSGRVETGGFGGRSYESGLTQAGSAPESFDAPAGAGASRVVPAAGALPRVSESGEDPATVASRSFPGFADDDSGRGMLASPQAAQWTRGVALVTMEVVGQSLTLTDSSLLASAARRAALAAEGLLPSSVEMGSRDINDLSDALSDSRSARWTAAETLGSAVPGYRATNQAAALNAFVEPSRLAARSRSTHRVGVRIAHAFSGPAAWSFAAFLPLLLLALAGLSERRA